jgi:hypothetical protein
MLSFIFLHHISNSIPLLIHKNQNNNNNNNINVKINIKSITRIFFLQILIPVKVKY